MIRCALLALTLLMHTAPAFAYIDPGSSLLVLQGVLAFIGGVIVFVRNPVQGLKDLAKKLRRKRNA